MKKSGLLLLYLFLTCFTASIIPQSISKEFDNYIKNFQKNMSVPSISAGVLSKGKIVWLGATGYADLENLSPATPGTVYRIASVSKSITAVAIMQLVEEGKIKLDDNIRNYIPYFPQKKWNITIRQLLNHTSGIRNYRQGEFDSKESYTSTKEAVMIFANDSLIFEPGTSWLYTTLGYNLLAAIIEEVSGTPFPAYLKKHIFDPCGMKSTSAEFQSEIVPNRAHGYEKNNFRKFLNAPLADLSIKFAGGGMISTSEDLLKFADNLLAGKLIKPSTLDTMLAPSILKNGRSLSYGLGFTTAKDNKGRRYCYHIGGGTGFSSMLIIYPKEQVAAVHLINARDRNIDNAAKDIAAIFFTQKGIYPRVPMSDELMRYYDLGGVDSVLAAYKKISRDSNLYDVSTEEAVLFGNDILNAGKSVDAITFFRFLIGEAPKDPKVYIGLADAYYKDGNKGMAVKNYRLVLSLDPKNYYAASMLKKLGSYYN